MNSMPAYSRLLGIDANKYKDLKKMCDNGIIPKAYHAFYKDLAWCFVKKPLLMTVQDLNTKMNKY